MPFNIRTVVAHCSVACRMQSLVAFLALAGTWIPGIAQATPPLGTETSLDDLDQTIECRRLLLEDPVLAPFNVGVRVRNRVATLWGPVPSRDVARRAEQCLRTMIELVEVRNQTTVAPDLDWGFPNGVPSLPNILPDRLPPPLPNPMRQLLPRLEEPEQADIAQIPWR